MTEMHLTDDQIIRFSSQDTNDFICLDTETTGLKAGNDEVLSLAIVNQDGVELFNHLIKPSKRKRWPEAAKVHGITWGDVKDEKELWEYEKELMAIFGRAKLLVCYNADFDLKMLKASGAKLPILPTIDLMHQYASAYGEWMEWKNDYKWAKLQEVAGRYGYGFEAHDALNDARATAYCYKAFVEDCQRAKDAKGDEYWAERTRLAKEAAEQAERKAKAIRYAKIAAVAIAAIAIIALTATGYIWSLILILIIIGVLASKKK